MWHTYTKQRGSMNAYKTGKILGICGHPLSGLAHIIIQGNDFSEVVHLESGFGLRQIANAFGSLEAAKGKTIRYSTDFLSVLEGFSPVEGGV